MSKNQTLAVRTRRELPFKVRPKANPPVIVGSEASGLLEIPIYGSLTVGENLEFLDLVKREDLGSLMKKAEEMREAEEKDSKEPVGDSKTEQEKLEETGRLRLTSDLASMMAKYNIEAATIIIKGRVDPEWTIEDTRGLNSAMVNEIAGVLQSELTASRPTNKDSDADGEAQDPT